MHKIGITINVPRRLVALKSKFKQEITLLDSYKTTLYEAYTLEQELLETHKEHRILNEHSTELFSFDVLNGKILK